MRTITKTEDLSRICLEFAESPYVTVDTEFIRERTYWSQLCLFQLARPGGDGDDDAVLIDPLAEGLDLKPLWDLMADDSVVKVFHAARQDVEIIWHQGGVMPTPLYDTQVAAMVCGHGEQVGYETLARKVARAEIDKSSRFTDWARRPLTPKQQAYALADVTHLRVIYEKLNERIVQAGRAHWVAEEMAVLVDPGTYDTSPENAWKRIKARTHKPRMLAVVRALAGWREATAQARDVPRGRVMRDDALLEIATAQPKSVEDLSKLRLVQREARKTEVAAEILAAVQAGLAVPRDECPEVPVPPRRREGSVAIAELLKVFLKARAEEIDVAPRLIAPTSDIEALAGEDDPDIALLKGWRLEVFGEDALRVKRGEVGLVAQPGGVRVVEVAQTSASE
ncbi:MAG: ribonuclease D [Pseudomonadota bacterium]